jgi:hypothetical protein
MADTGDSTTQCSQGRHSTWDDSKNRFVDDGPCEDPKHQVIDAATSALQSIKGTSTPGTGAKPTGEPSVGKKFMNSIGVGDPQSDI